MHIFFSECSESRDSQSESETLTRDLREVRDMPQGPGKFSLSLTLSVRILIYVCMLSG